MCGNNLAGRRTHYQTEGFYGCHRRLLHTSKHKNKKITSLDSFWDDENDPLFDLKNIEKDFFSKWSERFITGAGKLGSLFANENVEEKNNDN